MFASTYYNTWRLNEAGAGSFGQFVPEFAGSQFAQHDFSLKQPQARASGAVKVSLSDAPYIRALQYDSAYIWRFDGDDRVLTYYLSDQGGAVWTDQQRAAFRNVLDQISNVIDLKFEEVDRKEDANLIESLGDGNDGAYHYHLGRYDEYSISGHYDLVSSGPNQDVYVGSYDFSTFLHEIGHALGLEHPFHGNETFPGGVLDNDTSLGNHKFIHTLHTAMAYSSGYTFDDEGRLDLNSEFYLSSQNLYGYMSTLGVFDIIALGHLYGYNPSHKPGNDVYEIVDADPGADVGLSWVTIYDTGGVDEIRYSGEKNAFIDLRAATGDDTPTGGGLFSHAAHVYGGYTIAKDISIENATGGAGDDQIIGNELDNVIAGGLGADVITGGAGLDVYVGTAFELDGDTVIDFEAFEYFYIEDARDSAADLKYSANILSFVYKGTEVALTVTGSGTAGDVGQHLTKDGDLKIFFGSLLPAQYSISVSPSSVMEGDDGAGFVLTYTATRTSADYEATVDVAFSGTATAPGSAAADYAVEGLEEGKLVVPEGKLSATFTVTTRPDLTFEPDETIIATLSNASDGGVIDTAVAVAMIKNDDTAPVVIDDPAPVDPPVPVDPPPPNAPFIPVEVTDPTPEDGFNETRASASVFAFFNGSEATDTEIETLNEFVILQYDYYKALGVANPALGPYEALGRAFAETPEFAAKYGLQSEEEFIAEAYASVFGRDPTPTQQAHFQSQIDYFEALYEGAGIPDELSEILAKGVALGQMLGHASLIGQAERTTAVLHMNDLG